MGPTAKGPSALRTGSPPQELSSVPGPPAKLGHEGSRSLNIYLALEDPEGTSPPRNGLDVHRPTRGLATARHQPAGLETRKQAAARHPGGMASGEA